MPTKIHNGPLDLLRDDFRHHLEHFYASLNLAPPYHSLEKALRLLSREGQRKTLEELEHLLADSNLKWKFYDAMFVESGLSQKHRGIIKRLIESDQPLPIPGHYKNFLKAFQTKE